MKILLTVFLLLPLTGFADDIGYSRDQWEKLFSAQVDTALNTNYAFLAKMVADGAISLEQQLEQNKSVSAIIAARIRQAEESLNGVGVKNPAPALKESRLMLQAADAIRLHTQQLASLNSRMQKAYLAACEPESVKRLDGTFSSSGFIAAREMLKDLSDRINKVIENGVEGLTVSFGYSNGQIVTDKTGAEARGNDPNVARMQGAIVTGFMTAGAMLGTAIPIPVVGTIIGAIIGLIIGFIVGWIFGLIFGNPTSRIVGKLQDQGTYIKESVDSLERRGIVEPATRFCNLHMKNVDLAAIIADVDKRVALLRGQIDASLAEVTKSATTIDAVYKDELQRLKNDVYPTVQLLVNEKFEACYADIKGRSDEGKKYANAELVAPLKSFLAPDSNPATRFQAEKDLWVKLVEGDVRYAATNAFGFQKEASQEAKELMAWDGIAKAVYNKLDQRYSAEKESK